MGALLGVVSTQVFGAGSALPVPDSLSVNKSETTPTPSKNSSYDIKG